MILYTSNFKSPKIHDLLEFFIILLYNINMERNHNNFWIVVIFLILGIIAFSDSKSTQSNTEVPKTKDYGTVEMVPNYPDWTLLIPEIDFNQQMTKIIKQGSTLSVPDNNPGYYSENPDNLFIVGHNHSVFSRLSEIPRRIIIYQNSLARTYSLKNYQTLAVGDINMKDLLNYHGIVIMTCAGDYLEGHYTHRLILYYQ